MRKIGFLVLLFPFLFSFEARGDGYYSNDCYSEYCNPCKDWVVYGDWLYWRARRCDLDYAVIEFDGDLGMEGPFTVEPSYDHGFCAGIQKYCGDLFFDIFYTYFRTSATSSITGSSDDFTILSTRCAPFESVDAIKAKWCLDYDIVDVLIGYQLCNTNCFQSYYFGGFKCAFIDQKFKNYYIIPNQLQTLTQQVDMNAYGIDLGVGGSYNICNYLDFFVRTSYDVLLGNFSRRSVCVVEPSDIDSNYKDECWKMVSVFNLSFGLGYDCLFPYCFCSNLGFKIGYEFHQWIGQPGFLDFIPGGDGTRTVTLSRRIQSLGFDGLFVRLSLGF